MTMKKAWLLLLLLLPSLSVHAELPSGFIPEEGLVVFQSLPRSPLVDAIEGATHSLYSHCGIVHMTAAGEWVVIEAIGPVKETPLEEWIGQARDRRVAAFRVREPFRPSIPKFIAAAQTYEGRPYDIHYRFDDEAIYCSELVFKAFRTATGQDLGHVQALGELDWGRYVPVIQQIEQGRIPVERLMVTPRAVSEAAQLEKVFEG